MQIYRRVSHSCNYAVGTDPVWGISSNKLTFQNGIKMKLSVIFGILHMTIGIILKGTNNIYFKDYPSFFTEVVAGLIILLAPFGFMDLLIFGKWFRPLDIDDPTLCNEQTCPDNYQTPNSDAKPVSMPRGSEMGPPMTKGEYDNQHSPSVINIMIDLVFNFGSPKPEHAKMYPYIGETQDDEFTIGKILLIFMIVFIPIMLFVKPCCFIGTPPPADDNEIEFTNINNQENGQAINPSVENDDVMQKRQREIKSLEDQIKSMSQQPHGDSFGEAFVH